MDAIKADVETLKGMVDEIARKMAALGTPQVVSLETKSVTVTDRFAMKKTKRATGVRDEDLKMATEFMRTRFLAEATGSIVWSSMLMEKMTSNRSSGPKSSAVPWTHLTGASRSSPS